MEKREATEKEKWNSFVKKYGPRSGAFLYAWEWSELASGQRYEFIENNELVGLASVGRIFLPLGQSYISGICGPMATDKKNILKILETLADKHSLFIRFEPSDKIESPRIRKTISITPATTLITSLQPSVQELLGAMHPKTRYNIGLAQRKNLEVKFLKSGALDSVWSLFQETAKRDGFRIHPKMHYQNLLNLSDDSLQVFLVAVFFEGKAIAANIMVDFNETRTYLHGASSNQDRNLMAPFLLHWELMKEAKEKGLKFYDWWGIASSDDPKDPWAGITRFKKGFGGEVVKYPGTFDYIIKPFGYLFYKVTRRLARLVR
ncbi:MAG: peptidoglycan bridge formation glycyltransferase FemA/FemB family protein [Patescibacteria group bacterium]|jgi:lipid II:glycine glycyltransferase (peptidoglycan interpeptide bridge formation enzyme)